MPASANRSSSQDAGRNDPCPCGSGKKFKKCCIDKIAANSPVAVPAPRDILIQAQKLLLAREFAQAQTLIEFVLNTHPRNTDALQLLSGVHYERGELGPAEEAIRRAIAVDDKDAAFHISLGNIAKARGQMDEALKHYHKAVALKPKEWLATVYNNIGNCLHDMNDSLGALAWYDKALQVDPNFSLAWLHRGMANLRLGRYDDIEGNFKKAVAADPDNPVMLEKISNSYTEGRIYPPAIEILQHVIKLRPDYMQAWLSLANAYYHYGDFAAATVYYDHIATHFPPDASIMVERATLFPPIAFSNAEIDQVRARFMENLDRLMRDNFRFLVIEQQKKTLPFYQSYHGRNNRELMEKMAEFFLSSAPKLNYTAPHCLKPYAKKTKIRIGVVSEFFHTSLLNNFYQPLLLGLAEHPDFELTLLAVSQQMDSYSERLRDAAQNYIILPPSVEQCHQIIAAEEFDMLFYLEIGTSLMTYLMALARLAPVQCVTSGYPVTSGMKTLDYFLSNRPMEPQNAQEHYTEKLELFDRVLAVFNRTNPPQDSKTREELGLPVDATLYACPVLLFKIHPDMDAIFAAILARDPKGYIVLFDSENKVLSAANLKKRFAAAMGPELAARIHFLPFAKGDMFAYTLRAMDCILDTVHYSFGTTAYLMYAMNLPFVTWPGEFRRGREAYGLYNQMGIPELIAPTHEAYAELAVRLANDKAFYRDMSDKIRARSDKIFGDVAVVPEFIERLKQLHERHSA